MVLVLVHLRSSPSVSWFKKSLGVTDTKMDMMILSFVLNVDKKWMFHTVFENMFTIHHHTKFFMPRLVEEKLHVLLNIITVSEFKINFLCISDNIQLQTKEPFKYQSCMLITRPLQWWMNILYLLVMLMPVGVYICFKLMFPPTFQFKC